MASGHKVNVPDLHQRDKLIHIEDLIVEILLTLSSLQMLREHGVHPGVARRLPRLQSHGLHVSIENSQGALLSSLFVAFMSKVQTKQE